MVDYRRVLVLSIEGRSYRDVVEIVGCSHRDVARVREAVRVHAVTAASGVSDADLAVWFPDGRRRVSDEYDQTDLARVLASMKHNRHFTLLLGWRRCADATSPGMKVRVPLRGGL